MRWAVGDTVIVYGEKPCWAIWRHEVSRLRPGERGRVYDNGFDWFINDPIGGPFREITYAEAAAIYLNWQEGHVKTVLNLDGTIGEWKGEEEVAIARARISTLLPGFARLDRVALVCAAAGEHMLVVGKPGRAKSLWTRRVFAHLDGRVFDKELSKWSDETTLFGPPNLKELRESGRVEYFKRGFAEAEWISIQEFFDASDVLLRTMLGALQERALFLGQQPVKIPLRSCFATANYSRVNEVTEAVVDRFAFTVNTPELSKADRQILYDLGMNFEQPFSPTAPIALETLDAIALDAKDVALRDEAREMLIEWAEEASLTPRRERKIAKILRVSAAIGNRHEVTAEDALLLEYLAPLGNKQTSAADVVQKIKELTERDRIERFELRQVEQLISALPTDVKGLEGRYRALTAFKVETVKGKAKKAEALLVLTEAMAKGEGL